MLVLHGFWAARDGLCLWAEDSKLPVTSTSHALRSARLHPFAAPAGVLITLHAGKPGEADLLLPSLRTRPAGLPGTDQDHAPPGAALGAGAAALDGPGCHALRSPRRWPPSPSGHPASGTAPRWTTLTGLAAFAAELVARGRVLPTLDHDGAGAVARWRPVIRGPDVAAMHALIAAMPPVCRAAVPGHDDPHEVMAAALAALVDAAAREALPAGLALVPPRRGRLPARLPATEAWLTALTGSDGRFDADPGELSALARALAPWEDIGTGKTGPARATFRLAEVTAEPDDVLFGRGTTSPPGREAQAPGTAARRATTRSPSRAGGWSSCSSPSPTRAC